MDEIKTRTAAGAGQCCVAPREEKGNPRDDGTGSFRCCDILTYVVIFILQNKQCFYFFYAFKTFENACASPGCVHGCSRKQLFRGKAKTDPVRQESRPRDKRHPWRLLSGISAHIQRLTWKVGPPHASFSGRCLRLSRRTGNLCRRGGKPEGKAVFFYISVADFSVASA